MANTTELYNEWLEKAVKDPDLKTELESVKGKDEEINDRFYRDLEFGTGGLRGVIGAGTNRMNVYTVGKATQGLANYLKNTGKSDLKVAVAYDSRIKSDVFAKHAASIFAANGITANIYTELMPTPMLSWAVRALGCDAGIIVTASLQSTTAIRFTEATAVRLLLKPLKRFSARLRSSISSQT